MYEPTTVEIDRVCGEGEYRSQSLYFVGRLIQIVEAGHTKMRLLHSGARNVGGREVTRASQPGPVAIGSYTHSAADELPRIPRMRTSR